MDNGAEGHDGSTRWMPIRGGLVDPKHCRRMGDAVWLYLYLHNEGVFTKGVIREYTHKKAADALGLGERTVVRHMASLVKYGYVTLKQRQHDATVTISRYEPVENVTAAPPPTPPTMAILTPPGTPEVATLTALAQSQGSQERLGSGLEGSQVCHPHPYKKSKKKPASKDAGADALPATEKRTRTVRAHKEPPADTAHDPTTFTLAEALLTAAGLSVDVARKQGDLPRILGEVKRYVVTAYAGDPRSVGKRAALSCLAYMLTMPKYADRSWLSAKAWGKELGPWVDVGKPAEWTDPAKRPHRVPRPEPEPEPPPEPGSWQERIAAEEKRVKDAYRDKLIAEGRYIRVSP